MFRGDQAEAAPQAADSGETRSNRKALYLVGGVVGALVLAGGAFLLLNGSSSDDSGNVAAPPTNANAQPATPQSPPLVVKPATVTTSSRDPFAPLYTAPQPTSTPTPSSTSPAASTGSGSTTTTSPVTTPTTPPVTLTVRSINTTNNTATIGVNGKAYPTSVGATFATYYTLYSVFNNQCVGLLYGDQNVPVCLNKPATVTP
jgi:cytoskeletal protein RodZ